MLNFVAFTHKLILSLIAIKFDDEYAAKIRKLKITDEIWQTKIG